MNKVTYLSCWKPELCIQLEINNYNYVDFNRFLMKGCPSTKELQEGKKYEDAGREEFIFLLRSRFYEKLGEGASHSTLYNIFVKALIYLKWCDNQNIQAFTQFSLEAYMSHLNNQVMIGAIKSISYVIKRGQMVTLFTRYLALPNSYFNNVVVRKGNDLQPFEAYTRSDLNQLLPFIREVFKQTHRQFIDNPEKFISAAKNVPTMIFNWQGKKYLLRAGITKMMCAATYLLAYYTYANTSDLFKLKQPENASTTVGEVWYTMPAFKRRAFKTIHVEMGGHDLEIPKYALGFFDKLLSASKCILNDGDNATLLQTVLSNKVRPINSNILQAFTQHWLEKHFNFTDQAGRRLRPLISRFRETGAQLTAHHQGELVNNIMLNNTQNTRKKHYNTGNIITNNGMMQDTLSIREEQIKNNVSTKQAQANLGIKVLVIEAEYKANREFR